MHRVATLVAVLSASVASAQTIENFSSSFIEGMDKECRRVQRSDSQNANISDQQIGQYCNCVARHAVETVTMEEVFLLNKTGERPRSMQQKLNALGETCIEVMQGKLQDTPRRR